MRDTPSSRTRLDRLDLKILAALHREGRITKARMSEEVGLSATRCWERMQRLEQAGIIRGYHADIDLKKLAPISFYLAQVTLRRSSPAYAQQFERLVMRFDEIIACDAVLGSSDYFLLIVASSIEEYHAITQDLSEHGPEFDFVTHAITHRVKNIHSSSLLDILRARGAALPVADEAD